MEIDYYHKPSQSLEVLLEKYNPKIYLILDDVLASNKSYRFIFQDLLDILKWGFEIKEIRTKIITFKFHKADKKNHKMEIRHFLSNMILWRAFIDIDKVELLDDSYIVDCTKFSQSVLIDYINNKILPVHDGDFMSKNKAVDEICYSMNAISNAFSLLMGMGISIYDILQAEKRNPEIGDIIYGSIDASMQPVEIEQELMRRSERLIELFKNDVGNNDLKPFFAAGNILSIGQFKEMFVRIGFKADINGHTIPMLLDTNFLTDGLNKPSYAYVNSTGGRKSLVLTKTAISSPGAFAKKVNHMATSASYLRKDFEGCNSTAYIEYKIINDKFLRMLNGRYYYDKYGNMRQLDYEKDKDLIGKIVPFRSPTTCNSTEGICQYCYGHLFTINQDMASVGCLAGTKITEPLGQTILSSKHQQITNSSTIAFNDSFDKVFDLVSNEITLKEDTDYDEDLYILLDNIQTEESDDTEFYFTNSFKLIDTTGKIIYTVTEENGANIYLSDQLLTLYKKMKDKTKPISLESFDSDGDVLFTVEIKNKELTEPVKIIQKILNSNDKMGAKTLSEVCQIFAENLLGINIKYDLVHAESIIRGLIRKRSNDLEFPDWSCNGDHHDYQIMRLNAALFKNPSALISLSYGDLRRQLISPELYMKKAPSILDPMFVSQLSKYID